MLNAIIIGFNVRPDPKARRSAEESGIEIGYDSTGTLFVADDRDAAALLRVSGVGPAKIEKYGDDVLALVSGEDTAADAGGPA